MKKLLLLSAIVSLALVPASSQMQEGRRRNMPPGENVVGKVTSVGKDSLQVAPVTGGNPVTVKLGENTRIMKDRQPVKLDTIKADDVVFARGELKDNVMQAAIVSVVNPQMVQRFQQGGGPGQFNREDLGKKFIIGEVKAINETKLTVARPDGQAQEIEVDENTSFRRGRESITLPDIKVGDFVRGRGELKNGTFVPHELIVGRPQMRMMMAGPGAEGVSPPQTGQDSAKPKDAAPPKN